MRTDNLSHIISFLKVFSDGVYIMLLCHGIFFVCYNLLSRRRLAIFLCAAIFALSSFSTLYEAASFEIRAFHGIAYLLSLIAYRISLYHILNDFLGKIFSVLAGKISSVLSPAMEFFGKTVKNIRKGKKNLTKKVSSISQTAKKVYNTYIKYFNLSGRRNERKKEQDPEKS